MMLVYVVAYCDPQCEMLAVRGLADQGYWPYCPVERYHSRRLHRTAERPLFSRYLFVGLDQEARILAGKEVYRPILGTKGVRDYLRNLDGGPGLVEADAIEEIRKAEQAGAFDSIAQARLMKGSKIRIDKGAFSGFVGEIIDAGNKKRVRVLFSLLGRSVETTVPMGLINPVMNAT